MQPRTGHGALAYPDIAVSCERDATKRDVFEIGDVCRGRKQLLREEWRLRRLLQMDKRLRRGSGR